MQIPIVNQEEKKYGKWKSSQLRNEWAGEEREMEISYMMTNIFDEHVDLESNLASTP